MYFVYELVDPRTNEVRYVGITNCLETRFAQHLNWVNSTNDSKAAWVQELKQQKLQPQMRTIETVESEKEAREKERYWVRHYLDQNVQLTNIVHVPLIRRNTLPSNGKEREFFKRLNRNWEDLLKINQPLTRERLSKVFFHYTFGLEVRWASHRNEELVLSWKEKKQEEIQMMLADPDKYGLVPASPGDTWVRIPI